VCKNTIQGAFRRNDSMDLSTARRLLLSVRTRVMISIHFRECIKPLDEIRLELYRSIANCILQRSFLCRLFLVLFLLALYGLDKSVAEAA
jgi:hypothetical protein